MTTTSLTVYTVSLFFALNSLLLWSKRRYRVARNYRARLAADLVAGEESRGGK